MSEIVKSVSIENMANQRAAVTSLIAQAHALLQQAADLARCAHLGDLCDVFEQHRRRMTVQFSFIQADAPAKTMKHLDGAGWKFLMEESGMWSLMDSTARKAWREAIQKGDYPELTLLNIEATFSRLHESRADMFERGVIAIFERLSWDYKTNSPFKFGKRLIVDRLLMEVNKKNQTLHFDTNATSELDDLVRVFSILEAKPEPDHRTGMFYTLNQCDKAGDWHYDGEYFSLKWHKKGTGHLTFKRPDLVTQLNLIIAKHYPLAIAAEN